MTAGVGFGVVVGFGIVVVEVGVVGIAAGAVLEAVVGARTVAAEEVAADSAVVAEGVGGTFLDLAGLVAAVGVAVVGQRSALEAVRRSRNSRQDRLKVRRSVGLKSG